MTWHFAKTMPKIPHYYARKNECLDRKKFIETCFAIRAFGIEEKFFSKSFIYLYDENFKYWVMDKNPNDAQIINRAKS